jgi:hypothetical protein
VAGRGGLDVMQEEMVATFMGTTGVYSCHERASFLLRIRGHCLEPPAQLLPVISKIMELP